MKLYLDKIFEKNDLVSKTMNYYSHFFNDAQNAFEDIFGLSYKLFFGNQDCLSLLYILLEKYYRNEFFAKRFFINKVLSKTNDVYFTELPVNNSRADIVSICKHSTAYELKTEYDNLDRLKKQMEDYSFCFDYLYLVCHESKIEEASKLIPECAGIYIFDSYSKKMKLVKKAKINRNIDSQIQLEMFTVKELENEFGSRDMDYIINKYSKNKINDSFKKVNIEKHMDSWNRIKNECSFLENIH